MCPVHKADTYLRGELAEKQLDLDKLRAELSTLRAERDAYIQAVKDWRNAMMDCWAKDHRATMTALLESGRPTWPSTLRAGQATKEVMPNDETGRTNFRSELPTSAVTGAAHPTNTHEPDYEKVAREIVKVYVSAQTTSTRERYANEIASLLRQAFESPESNG